MPPRTRFHLNFVGDVMLGRLIDQLLPTHVNCIEESQLVSNFSASNPGLRDYSFKSPWGNTLPLFHSSHLNLINLETSITNHPKPWPDKVFNYRMHPTNIRCLKEARVDYASLANNHTLDFSEEGLMETVLTLKGSRISFAGAGETREEARRPAVLELHSDDETFTVHVYSASDHPSDWTSVPNFYLIDYLPATRLHLKNLLTSLPTQPDLKIFSVHWGPNYCWTPSDDIRSLAHFLIDECGVDIIHGHSSHHIQGVEVYREKLILYGCGDFVDDYAVKTEFRNDLSAIWRVNVESVQKEGGKKLSVKGLEVFPTRIKCFQANLLKEEDLDHLWVRTKFQELCEGFGTEIPKALGEESHIVVEIC